MPAARPSSKPIARRLAPRRCSAKGSAGKSFIVTTGTGSGKSMCFLVPIIDAIIRARKAGQPARTRAIIVFPMNALANSQMKEIDGFIKQAGLPENLQPVVKRYTGPEDDVSRQTVAANPPDVLLTNFMLLALLLTRQDKLDETVIGNAKGLESLVLDELHTCRGRLRCFKLLGERVKARDFDRQVAELQIPAAILNRLTALGTPKLNAWDNSVQGKENSASG